MRQYRPSSPEILTEPMAPAALTSRKKTKGKLSRAEKNEDVRRRLFMAAAKIVGRHGYAAASVARITARAKVAQGTFYLHFANRQELLDQLLPTIGRTMLQFIRERVDLSGSEEEREMARFRAFFDFLREVPEFLRILDEAEFFAPKGFQQHLDNVAGGYNRILRRACAAGAIAPFSDKELEVIAYLLLGARAYLSRRYAYAEKGVQAIPDYVLSAYEKLLTGGMFTDKVRRASEDRPARAAARQSRR